MSAKVSVIIPITGKARKAHLLSCIRSLRNQKYKNYEIVLVEQIDCDIGGQRTMDKFYAKAPVDKYISIRNSLNFKFNQPWMSNVGAKISSGDKLLFFDVDLVVAPDYLNKVAACASHYFYAWNAVHHYTKKVSRQIHKSGKWRADPNAKLYKPAHNGHAGYAACVDRDFFFNQLGCYSENYFGWGGNDNDITARCRNLLGNALPALEAPIFHMWHPRGYAKTSVDNRNLVFATRMFPGKVIERLLAKVQDLGSPKNPTLIKMNDLIAQMKDARKKRKN